MTIKQCLAIAVLAPVAIFAQASTGTLSGLIVDPSGATVGSAEIAVREDRISIERRLTADAGGAFTFTFLRPGRYTLVATHDGFAPAQLNDVLILARIETVF
jgi:Carboxypeptidase regulatory-like domain